MTHWPTRSLRQRAATAFALYCFSRDAEQRRIVLTRTHSGGVTINDWGWHVVNHDAPFGGVGDSGMGAITASKAFANCRMPGPCSNVTVSSRSACLSALRTFCRT